jgi:cell division control protein 24
LLKKSSPVDYPHYEELKAGSAAAKRITDKINEAQRRAENLQTVQNLAARVDDWKGHHVSQFGELLLDDIFIVTKSEVDREYHVFLFERIILCCKEDTSGTGSNNKKVSKSNSLLKKPQANGPLVSGLAGGSKKKMTPLLLKGRIYLNNVTEAKVVSPGNLTVLSPLSYLSLAWLGSYSLNIWWKGDDDLEFFTLRCRNEEQVKQWETAVKRLIEKVAMRRASERSSSRLAHFSTHSGYPSSHPRNGTHERGYSTHPAHVSSHPHPYTNGHRPYRQSSPYDEHAVGNGITSQPTGPPGYPPHDGFDPDDDFDDYSVASSISPTSGRTTPFDGRRGATTPGLDHYLGYERPRAHTEDANGPALSQWRSNVPGLPPAPSSRMVGSRMGSAMSYVSEPGSRSSAVRPQLRSQYSSSRLRPPYDSRDPRRDVTSSPVPPPHNLVSRSRSASQPSAYVPKGVPPPMPSNGWDRVPASTSNTTMKRSSSSSQSTGEDSAYSPNSSSPITPFGSSDSSLSGAVGRSSISSLEDPVKVKVHFGSDIFVIQVSRSTEYGDLVERVGKKIRLCGPRRDDGPLRVQYEDEEGDLISMRSAEDVDMAFGDKAQVVLHVT